MTPRWALRARIGAGAIVAAAAAAGCTPHVVPDPAIPPRVVHVSPAAAWTDTGLAVHRGEWLLFSATGDVSWAARKETTTADGTHGMPGFVGAGGLVGRIAGTTRSFPIGARTQPYRVNLRSRATKPAPPIRMPADGVLELGFKDYVAGDNTGELVVTIKEGR